MAGRGGQNSDDDSYELVDLLEYSGRQEWWGRIFGQSSGPVAEKYSVATQLMMGGVTGWCAGFVFKKIGKLAATAIGGGFLLMQWVIVVTLSCSLLLKVDTQRGQLEDCFTHHNHSSLHFPEVANHSGYIKVDWKRVEKDVNKAKRQLRKKANKAAPEINTFIEESAEFVKKNIVLASGFVGGFLLGLAS
ncbi:FUN14 domain-containing protein 1 isoform X1 [Stegostoma tigrinum]|uniref:FUN14 domain-containing protein 1 isoform X1 n=2 Tax=Stegostoma tigrinum TaxID=3053191 RepID=UPI00202B5D9F|nr:FUN14 domain-containing protein 1 isoform X1 [Stegostoma tigrinum]